MPVALLHNAPLGRHAAGLHPLLRPQTCAARTRLPAGMPWANACLLACLQWDSVNEHEVIASDEAHAANMHSLADQYQLQGFGGLGAAALEDAWLFALPSVSSDSSTSRLLTTVGVRGTYAMLLAIWQQYLKPMPMRIYRALPRHSCCCPSTRCQMC
jgi:hypothetical protein